MKCFIDNGQVYFTKSFNNHAGRVIKWNTAKKIVEFDPFMFDAYSNDYKEIPFPKEEEKYFIIYIFGCVPSGRNLETIRKCL